MDDTKLGAIHVSTVKMQPYREELVDGRGNE
jgi:hypothetical protein